MASSGIRSFLEALDEPALILQRGVINCANGPARKLLGAGIEGKDIRLAIRNPDALEHILPGTPGDVEVSGIGGFGRPWVLSIRRLEGKSVLVRLTDRSAFLAAERMRVDFVANASHELRTPLATVLGYGETLADGGLPPSDCARFGGVIRTEARRMLRIIEDLMSLSRIEADRFVSPTERVSMASIAQSAVEEARRLTSSEKCTIELHVDDGLPQIVGDRGQLLQVLDNLLSNAIRYGCRNGACTARVALTLEKSFIRLSVADDGPGIAPEHLPRVTQRFYRVDAARSRDTGGTGLGLAIVKHIVERHGGTLSVSSVYGNGTEVTVRLPIPS